MSRRLVLILVGVLVLGGLFLAFRPNTPSAGPQERSLDVAIRGDTMTPSKITLGAQDKVTLRVTADQPVDLHLHGYDIEEKIEPGKTTTITFEAKITGSFEIENEQTKVQLGTLIVQPQEGR